MGAEEDVGGERDTGAKSQADKFREAASAVGADDDEARFAERLRRIETAKPKGDKTEQNR
jgi:hypothetical protein